MSKRVVITGLGTVNSLGMSVHDTWSNILKSKSGISKIQGFDTELYATKIAAEIKTKDKGGDIDLDQYLDPKERKRISNFITYSLIAAEEAIKDSGIASNNPFYASDRIGVAIGSGVGGLSDTYTNANLIKEKGPKKLSPFYLPSILINMASANVAIKYNFTGFNFSHVSACSSSAHAIGESYNMIKSGNIDAVVCGGSEACVSEIGIASFNALRALSTKNDTPENASMPYDKKRDGFVMGEGAAVIILESYENAKKRNATIYGEIIGYGSSCDANHITAPDKEGKGACASMNMALKDANINPSDIQYINAHGTSTPLGDIAEINAMRKTFGDYLPKINISSTKSSTGHLLGAAGSLEAIFSIMSIKSGIIPPTLNLNEPDDEVLDLSLTPLVPQEKNITYAISNSFGFGGTNASLIFKKA